MLRWFAPTLLHWNFGFPGLDKSKWKSYAKYDEIMGKMLTIASINLTSKNSAEMFRRKQKENKNNVTLMRISSQLTVLRLSGPSQNLQTGISRNLKSFVHRHHFSLQCCMKRLVTFFHSSFHVDMTRISCEPKHRWLHATPPIFQAWISRSVQLCECRLCENQVGMTWIHCDSCMTPVKRCSEPKMGCHWNFHATMWWMVFWVMQQHN